jgi:NO-binding membrane sensor protein with MHYT domain
VHVTYYTYGAVTPVLSLGFSVLGCMLGLVCGARVRSDAGERRRTQWLLLSAWAIGGTGIWVALLTASLGFSVGPTPVRYDPVPLLVGMVLALVGSSIGCIVAGSARRGTGRSLIGGAIIGLSAAATHFATIAAIRLDGRTTIDPTNAVASVAFGTVLAALALWLASSAPRGQAAGVAALLLGLAITGMHHAAMYGLRVTPVTALNPGGMLPTSLLGPVLVLVISAIVVLLVALLSRTGLGVTAPVVPPSPHHAPSRERTTAGWDTTTGRPTDGSRMPIQPHRRTTRDNIRSAP